MLFGPVIKIFQDFNIKIDHHCRIGGGPAPGAPSDRLIEGAVASSLFTRHSAIHFVVAVPGITAQFHSLEWG